ARDLDSAAMLADATQTEFCTYLSAILLGGLLLNALLGWWWADPVAALVKDGKPRTRLALEPNGTPKLMLDDDSGQERIGLTLEYDGTPSLDLFDKANQSRVGL